VFKLRKEVTNGGVSVTLDGRLSSECAEVIEALCTQAASEGRTVELHLHDVSEVEEAGWRMLRRLVKRGIPIHAEGIYVSYAVQELARPQ
jgi:hypothetical protein